MLYEVITPGAALAVTVIMKVRRALYSRACPFVLPVIHEIVDNSRIGQGGNVTQVLEFVLRNNFV